MLEAMLASLVARGSSTFPANFVRQEFFVREKHQHVYYSPITTWITITPPFKISDANLKFKCHLFKPIPKFSFSPVSFAGRDALNRSIRRLFEFIDWIAVGFYSRARG
jgi:hypothetical protein